VQNLPRKLHISPRCAAAWWWKEGLPSSGAAGMARDRTLCALDLGVPLCHSCGQPSAKRTRADKSDGRDGLQKQKER
jgi:hypothetical protein